MPLIKSSMDKDDNHYALLELQIKHEKELRELEAKNAQLNLEKQNIEYLRRFEESNHNHANAIKDRTELLQKSTYDQFKDSFDVWRLELTQSITEHHAREEGSRKTWSIVVVVLSLVITISGIIIDVLLRKVG